MTKFNLPLDRDRLFSEILELNKLKNQQIEEHIKEMKRRRR